MKATLKKSLLSLLMLPLMALGVTAVVPAVAYAVPDGTCNAGELSLSEGVDCAKGEEQQGDLFAPGGLFQTITNVLLFLVGAVAVIMLIIGGIRYVISGGDQSAVTSAKNTILYAIVGIVVALLAYGIVNFVVTQLNR